MNKAMDRIKQAWNENPLMVIGVGAMAATALSKLMEANTQRKYARVHEMEIQRRLMTMKPR